MVEFVERDLTEAELARVHAGFDEHGREHGNAAPPRTRRGFVLMDGTAFVGCVTGLRDNRWYCLTDLWIEKALRGRGLGGALLRLWEDRVAADGVRNVYLWTAGFQAPKFYERHGYAVFAELSDYHQSGHSRIGLRKALPRPSRDRAVR